MVLEPVQSSVPFRHGKHFVVAQLHITESDEDSVGHCAIPDLGVSKGTEPNPLKMGLHVQKQSASGEIVNLQNILRQGYYS